MRNQKGNTQARHSDFRLPRGMNDLRIATSSLEPTENRKLKGAGDLLCGCEF
ncbi:hypothetical protein J5I95_09940 [Candidatus Poribacteria bacterium]|nr:hypothetical protein [Candidatus Poribacteria bacterium]